MKRLACLLFPLLAACSAGPLMYPESTAGRPTLLYPTCPGPQTAMRFTTTSNELNWVFLLVHVSLPGGEPSPPGATVAETEVRLSTQLYMEHSPKRALHSQGQSETADKVPLWITASSPMATVQLANGKTYQVSIERLKTGFDPRAPEVRDVQYPGSPLGKGDMGDFILTLPELYLNGEKINTAPIHFKKREERYFPIFNC